MKTALLMWVALFLVASPQSQASDGLMDHYRVSRTARKVANQVYQAIIEDDFRLFRKATVNKDAAEKLRPRFDELVKQLQPNPYAYDSVGGMSDLTAWIDRSTRRVYTAKFLVQDRRSAPYGYNRIAEMKIICDPMKSSAELEANWKCRLTHLTLEAPN